MNGSKLFVMLILATLLLASLFTLTGLAKAAPVLPAEPQPGLNMARGSLKSVNTLLAHPKAKPLHIPALVMPLKLTISTTANPTSILEPGGVVTYTVLVTNTSPMSDVTLTGLTDTLGSLDSRGTCATGGTITDTAYTCSFTTTVSGNANDISTNTITATVSDGSSSAEASDGATVTITDAPPDISVTKQATPTAVLETGGNVTFTIQITNNSAEEATLISLTDSDFGNLDSQGTCAVTQTLAAGVGTYSCSFTEFISGDASGPAYQNTITATVQDDEANEIEPTATATVDFIDVTPAIEVRKDNDANGDGTFTDNEQASLGDTSVTFQVTITNTTDEDVTINSISDDTHSLAGSSCEALETTTLAANDSTTCTFSGTIPDDDNLNEVNQVSVIVSDNEGNEDTEFDTSTVTTFDIQPFVIVSKEPSTTSIAEPGEQVTFSIAVVNPASQDDVTIVSITDQPYGSLTDSSNPNISNSTCATGVFIPTGSSYSCSFQAQVTGNFGDSKSDIVTVRVEDDDGNIKNFTDSATIFIDVNVPSSLNATKTPNKNSVNEPGENVQFTVVVENTSPADAVRIDSISDDTYTVTGCNQTLPHLLAVGGKITCIFTGFVSGQPNDTHTNTLTASGIDDDGFAVSDNAQASVSVVDVPSSINVTKTANPTSVVEPGGTVQFTVQVNNTSPADSVTITGLNDTAHGNLNGKGNCSVPKTINPGAFYQCTYSANVSGAGGEVKSSTVTVNATDDDGNALTAKGKVSVTIAKLTKVYLPLVILPGPTVLSIFNDNTGAAATVVIRDVATNQEITRCTVPNGATLPCDHDGDGSNVFPPGNYKIEVDASCGFASAIKNYVSGPVTTRVFCK